MTAGRAANKPITQWSTTPDHHSHPQHHHPYTGVDQDTSAANADNSKDVEPRSPEVWSDELLTCCSSPLHLLTAIFFPWASGVYSARGIDKLPIAVGVALGAFYYATVAFIALAAVSESQPSVTVAGMEFALWPTGAAWATLHFVTVVWLLRRWMRSFYEIRGTRTDDAVISCLLSCCALAQMSKHTARVKHDGCASTLQAYAA